MAIAIGFVIDDAVVITENIARHLALGSDRRTAIREAVQELIWPVTTSTITTVVVFLPLGLLEGVVGQFFTALSITLTIAVLVSLALALTVIPLLSEQFVTAHDVEAGGASVIARIARTLDRLAARVRALARARVARAAPGGGRGRGAARRRASSPGGWWAPRSSPGMDEGAFVLDYFTPGGTSLAESDRLVHQVEVILAGIPEVAGTSRRLGAELGLFATMQNRGDIVVRLAPRSQRSALELRGHR